MSSEILAIKGKIVELSAFLPDYATDKFVRATILQSDGVTVVDTLLLTHGSNGIYVNSSFEFPSAQDYLICYVQVFEDALYTLESYYEPYSFGINASGVSGSGGGGGDDSDIIVYVEDEDIIVYVEDNNLVAEEDIIVYVEDEPIFVYVEDQEIIVHVEEDEEITVYVGCE